ncbi:MAG TPA: transketolase [Polyangiaceae bacterium]|nr:transketolase [Polyangiaceae bacterium]
MPVEIDPKTYKLAIDTIKTLSMDAVEKAKSGHPGTPMGLAEIAFEIFVRYLRHDPKDPSWIGRDRFVLSCGHASMLLYSMLHLSGYPLSLDELKSFRQWGSKTPGHPEHGHTAGVETTTGPLGQGVGNAVGFALGQKMLEARFGAPFAGQHVYCIASDGDVMEGVSGEASSIAGHLGLSNLIVFYDDNRITIEGDTKLAFSEDVGARYEAYGWSVQRIDGHNPTEIRTAIERARASKDQPSFIVCRTHIGHGAPGKQDTASAHGEPLGEAEIAETKKLMGWDPNAKFFVPEAVSAFFASRAAELAADHAAWDAEYRAWRGKSAELAKALDAFFAKKLPEDLLEQLLAAVPEKEDATRNTSNAIQQTVAKLVPQLVGGSADLAPSTKTLIKGATGISRGSYEGRNLHFGIREHGMGAVCNGLALTGGFIPYGSTFLIFSDYMRPSVRLSALMEQQCLWIYTHDSVFLGEDGPTHQPIEQLWALRLIPNLAVVRPADGAEVAAAWALALGRTKGPTAFALTRQKVPNLTRSQGFDPKSMLRGCYVLQEASGGKPDVVLVASGSELHLAVGARERLEKAGRKVRVVSALCLETFAEQDASYRESVLPRGVRMASIEAGRTTPWHSIVGEGGLALGIDRFGASAPDKVLGDKFGFTVDAVTSQVEALLSR